MELKQRNLLTSCVPLLVRIVKDVTLLNLIRILHNKGGKVVWYFVAFLLCRSLTRRVTVLGVQHLLIGFHVVTISLKATLGRMLERAVVHVSFQGGKSFH